MKVAAPYPSPVERYDALAQVVVVEHRNTQTGELDYQSPSAEIVREKQLAALAAHAVPGATDAKPGVDARAVPPSQAASADGGNAGNGDPASGQHVSILV